jgi:hypothetical protein
MSKTENPLEPEKRNSCKRTLKSVPFARMLWDRTTVRVSLGVDIGFTYTV